MYWRIKKKKLDTFFFVSPVAEEMKKKIIFKVFIVCKKKTKDMRENKFL